jgi:hypothetical protein
MIDSIGETAPDISRPQTNASKAYPSGNEYWIGKALHCDVKRNTFTKQSHGI